MWGLVRLADLAGGSLPYPLQAAVSIRPDGAAELYTTTHRAPCVAHQLAGALRAGPCYAYLADDAEIYLIIAHCVAIVRRGEEESVRRAEELCKVFGVEAKDLLRPPA